MDEILDWKNLNKGILKRPSLLLTIKVFVESRNPILPSDGGNNAQV